MNKNKYEEDFYAWTQHSAQLLREGRFCELDLENIIEEIESMGKRDKRELISRATILIFHLLKWKFQPEKRSKSWRLTIYNQRCELDRLIKDSPSLIRKLENEINDAYQMSIKNATVETGLEEKVFPKECPYSLNQILDEGFL